MISDASGFLIKCQDSDTRFPAPSFPSCTLSGLANFSLGGGAILLPSFLSEVTPIHPLTFKDWEGNTIILW